MFEGKRQGIFFRRKLILLWNLFVSLHKNQKR